eukprot:c841_g1_i1 orf=61-561(+)
MAGRGFVFPAPERPSAFPSSLLSEGGGQFHLLQHFVCPFLHQLHLRSMPRGASVLFTEALNRLQQDLAAYSGAPESQKQEETRTAERLVQALFMHRILLCNSEAGCYVKILQKLWELEDQGLVSRRCERWMATQVSFCLKSTAYGYGVLQALQIHHAPVMLHHEYN